MRSMPNIDVKIIRVKGKAALVEYSGNRVIVPESAINDKSQVSEGDLEASIPYGIDWEDLGDVTITKESIVDNLHQAGVWTYEDFLKDSNLVVGALQSALGLTFSSLAAIAKKSKSTNL